MFQWEATKIFTTSLCTEPPGAGLALVPAVAGAHQLGGSAHISTCSAEVSWSVYVSGFININSSGNISAAGCVCQYFSVCKQVCMCTYICPYTCVRVCESVCICGQFLSLCLVVLAYC